MNIFSNYPNLKKNLQTYLQHLLIVFLFVFVSLVYFYPVLEGKVLSQMDYNHSKGIAQEVIKYEKETGETILWTNSIFGGMPSYQVKGGKRYSLFTPIRRALRLNLDYTTASILFIYLLGFYILLISLDINKWLSLVGALSFGLSSYNIIIILAGHITKCYAIAYMAPVVAGFILIFKKKYIIGAILSTLALGVQISTSHVQIVYYTGILIGFLFVYQLIMAIINKSFPVFGKSMAIITIAVIFALLPNMMMLNEYYEVAKYSIRGDKYIGNDADKKESGLNKDYALAWSYGKSETWTMLIPNAKGGSSGYIGKNSELMVKIGGKYKEAIARQSQYWGDQPFTSGPVYFGAIVMFFFILGLFVVESKLKWWLLAGTIISILLSWGQNFEPLTNLFFNYVPFYNKFRTVSMTLVIASVTVPMLAFMAISEIVKNKKVVTKNMYALYISFGLTGGLALIFWLVPSVFSFLSAQEASYFNEIIKESPEAKQQINAFVPELEAARTMIFKADAIRSFLYILVAAGFLFVFLKIEKFKKGYLFLILGVLILADMWVIDNRYLNPDMFQRKQAVRNEFKATPADNFIKKDVDPNYRVLNLTRSVFNDAFTPYFHKSLGGYHGAKLRKYQDIIDYYLDPYVRQMQKELQDEKPDVLEKYVPQMQVINMLNTKYVIDNPSITPYINANAYGNVWFVDSYKMVENHKEEIESLETTNLLRTVVVNKKNLQDYKLPELKMSANDSGSIALSNYHPDRLTYKSSSTKDEFAVFSEIYYPKGWKAYIDNKEVDYINVNYILRGLHIPAGTHTIEFKFEPKAHYITQAVALISSIIILLAILLIIAKTLFDKHKKGELFPKKEEKKTEEKPKKAQRKSKKQKN